MSSSEYQKRQDGSNTVFDVEPAAAPKNIPMLVGAVLFTLAFGALSLWAVPFGVAVAYLAWKDGRPKEHRQKAIFSVSSAAIESNGRTFSKADIHRILVQNRIAQHVETSYAANSGGRHAVAVSHGLKIADVSYSLDLESGGKAYMLAGGMNETTAFGLLTDVCRVIGFKTS